MLNFFRESIPAMKNENGFVLVTALLIMVVLTIIGIASTMNTSIELQIAGNDKVHKKTFYAAEGGAILGAELLEQNLNCSTGFVSSAIEPANNINVDNDSLAFWRNDYPTDNDACNIGLADISFPIDYNNSATADTYLAIGGGASLLPGGSLQMAAGYEGKGKSAAGGGVAIQYDIYANHQGLNNSESIIVLGWRHVVGNEAKCNYD